MIELNHISKSFGSKKVLHDFSLSVHEGETLVLLGLSGCGKTTCLKLMNGLLNPEKGEVLINSKPLTPATILAQRRNMGYVIQYAGLFPHYTVFENIATVPRLLGWHPDTIKERVVMLMEKLHLPPSDFKDKYPDQLSGGQQQRVGLARALASDPPVLLMDEPFGALDPITRQSIRQEFVHLDELRQKTIVLVTHDVQEAFELGDRIALMQKGKLIANGTPQELLQSDNAFLSDFFGNDRFILMLKSKGIYNHFNENIAAGKLTMDQLQKLINES